MPRPDALEDGCAVRAIPYAALIAAPEIGGPLRREIVVYSAFGIPNRIAVALSSRLRAELPRPRGKTSSRRDPTVGPPRHRRGPGGVPRSRPAAVPVPDTFFMPISGGRPSPGITTALYSYCPVDEATCPFYPENSDGNYTVRRADAGVNPVNKPSLNAAAPARPESRDKGYLPPELGDFGAPFALS